MAGRCYTIDDVLAYMDIPLPEEDEMSEDEFDGYTEDNDREEECGRDDDDDVQGGGADDNSGRDDGDTETGEGGSVIPEYTRHPGCTQDMTDKSPLEFLALFITDAMLDRIVAETNLYAEQFIASHDLAPQSRVHGWSRAKFDKDELKRLLAVIIVMGLVNYPTLEDYWATSWPYVTPTFSKVNREPKIDCARDQIVAHTSHTECLKT